jgi:hypothetical protein
VEGTPQFDKETNWMKGESGLLLKFYFTLTEGQYALILQKIASHVHLQTEVNVLRVLGTKSSDAKEQQCLNVSQSSDEVYCEAGSKTLVIVGKSFNFFNYRAFKDIPIKTVFSFSFQLAHKGVTIIQPMETFF